MMLLLNSRNRVVGLLRDGRAARASSAADESRAPERRFPLLSGLVSLLYRFWLLYFSTSVYYTQPLGFSMLNRCGLLY